MIVMTVINRPSVTAVAVGMVQGNEFRLTEQGRKTLAKSESAHGVGERDAGESCPRLTPARGGYPREGILHSAPSQPLSATTQLLPECPD